MRTPNTGKDVKKLSILHISGRNVKQYSYFGKGLAVFKNVFEKTSKGFLFNKC